MHVCVYVIAVANGLTTDGTGLNDPRDIFSGLNGVVGENMFFF